MRGASLPGLQGQKPGAKRSSAEDPFNPRRFLRNGHLQTIFGNFLLRQNRLSLPLAELVKVEPATSTRIASHVLCHCHMQPEEVRASSPSAIIVHGLEGSSSSQYVVGNANKLWSAGCNVIRMNMRNCGGTESLSPTLYHSGLSHDIAAVVNFFATRYELRSISLIGYSMGGNLVLKLAGELGSNAPPCLRSVVGISPAVDLAASADALHEPLNRLYEIKFLRSLVKRYGRKASLFPGLYDPDRARGLRSLREFDDRVTAFYAGFTGADDYYFRAAAARVIPSIAIPALIIHALDDPFVRLRDETRRAILANPYIEYVETPHGGHCAFLADPDAALNDDGYWAESMLLRFLLAHS